MNTRFSRNLSMLTDFYELTMSNGYFSEGKKDTIGIFDLFFRKVPDDGGFAIMCGIKQIIDYISELSFDSDDILFLKEKGFSDVQAKYLKQDIKNTNAITFVASTFNDIKKTNIYLDMMLNWLKNINIIFKKIYLIY